MKSNKSRTRRPARKKRPVRAPRPPSDIASDKARFIEGLRLRGVVGFAARASGVPRATAYEWRSNDEAFAKRWDEAKEDACDAMESEAYRRATKGTLKPVYQKGELVGHVREFSDALLALMLRAKRPREFRERHEFAFDPSSAPVTGVLLVPGTAKPEEWPAIVAANTNAGASTRAQLQASIAEKPKGETT